VRVDDASDVEDADGVTDAKPVAVGCVDRDDDDDGEGVSDASPGPSVESSEESSVESSEESSEESDVGAADADGASSQGQPMRGSGVVHGEGEADADADSDEDADTSDSRHVTRLSHHSDTHARTPAPRLPRTLPSAASVWVPSRSATQRNQRN
jgi:hypothetical protein